MDSNQQESGSVSGNFSTRFVHISTAKRSSGTPIIVQVLKGKSINLC